MTEDFYQKLVLAIAPAITERTLVNLRHILEQQYILSTAQDASPEQQKAYSAEVIAKAELAAALDNARTIAFWVQAIITELTEAKERAAKIDHERKFIESSEVFLKAIEKGTAYPTFTPEKRELQKTAVKRAVHEAKCRLSGLTQGVPDLRQETPAGDSSQSRSTGGTAA